MKMKIPLLQLHFACLAPQASVKLHISSSLFSCVKNTNILLTHVNRSNGNSERFLSNFLGQDNKLQAHVIRS